MNESTLTSARQESESVQYNEKFLLKRKADIIRTLKLLAKNNEVVSAVFDGGKYSFLTTVVNMLEDKNLVVLDFGSNESINKKLLTADRVRFTTEHDGIKGQFSTNKVIKATFKGDDVFAIPIPDAMLWLQRRQCYRIKIPITDPIKCRISLEDKKNIDYNVLDISASGLALFDPNYTFEKEQSLNKLLENCTLMLHGLGEEIINLEVRNQLQVNKGNRSEGQRVGCAFKNLSFGIESKIQKYMQSVERQRSHIAKN